MTTTRLAATLLLALLIMISGPRTTAAADGDAGTACGSVPGASADTTAPDHGFFPERLTTVWVYSQVAEAEDVIEEVTELIVESYIPDEPEIEIIDRIDAVVAAVDERIVIIDDDLGIPGEPRQYGDADSRALHVHWSTAVADLEPLLADECRAAAQLDDGDLDDGDLDEGERDDDALEAADAAAAAPPASDTPDTPDMPDTPEIDGVMAVWDLAEDEAQVLTGYQDDLNYNVVLPIGWQVVGEASLASAVVASEIARQDVTLRVDVDDQPVRTWSLDDLSGIEVPIAADAFLDGGFSLSASTTTPIINDGHCPDPGHVGRWVDLGLPVISASIAPTELDVARAVAGFGQISRLTEQPIGVRLLGGYTLDDDGVLDTLGALAAAIGHHEAPVGWVMLDAAGRDVNGDAATGPLIELAPAEDARVGVRVEGTRPVLTLLGPGEALGELAHTLADPDRLLYFHDSTVAASDVPATVDASREQVFGFAEAGYDDRTLRGSGERSLIYRLHVPAGLPPDRATLALYGTYSPVLAETGATFSVRINGSEEEIVAIAEDTGRLEVLHTITPADLRPGLNYVKITADTGRVSTSGCDTGPQGWLTVSRSSALAVQLGEELERPRLGVEDARFALASTVDFTEADVAIATAEGDQVETALFVIGELASRADGGAPTLVIDDDARLDRHLVIVGPAPGRELLDDVLPLETSDTVGIVGAVPSPHETGRVLLAFTGGNATSTAMAVEAALSADVNDVTDPFAVVGLDTIRSVDGNGEFAVGADVPEQLAFTDEQPGPPADEYEAWLLEQAERIQAASAPQAEVRRTVAFALLLVSITMFGLGWVRRTRQKNAAGSTEH